jgi:hypothetical protein
MTDTPTAKELFLAEVERLRSLLKAVEWEGSCMSEAACPFCREYRYNAGCTEISKHMETCPAFTPEGEVK